MDTYYHSQIEQFILTHSELSKKIITEMYEQALELYELRDLSKEEARTLYFVIKDEIIKAESPYDLTKLTYAIQSSTSSLIGGHAMTKYKCSFCGKIHIHGSTATPKICHACAETMATAIMRRQVDIIKDER